MEHTAEDGKVYETQFYNLDAIISVGYRVNSLQATQFRIWATQTLKEFIIKGFKQRKPTAAYANGGLDQIFGWFFDALKLSNSDA